MNLKNLENHQLQISQHLIPNKGLYPDNISNDFSGIYDVGFGQQEMGGGTGEIDDSQFINPYHIMKSNTDVAAK